MQGAGVASGVGGRVNSPASASSRTVAGHPCEDQPAREHDMIVSEQIRGDAYADAAEVARTFANARGRYQVVVPPGSRRDAGGAACPGTGVVRRQVGRPPSGRVGHVVGSDGRGQGGTVGQGRTWARDGRGPGRSSGSTPYTRPESSPVDHGGLPPKAVAWAPERHGAGWKEGFHHIRTRPSTEASGPGLWLTRRSAHAYLQGRILRRQFVVHVDQPGPEPGVGPAGAR